MLATALGKLIDETAGAEPRARVLLIAATIAQLEGEIAKAATSGNLSDQEVATIRAATKR